MRTTYVSSISPCFHCLSQANRTHCSPSTPSDIGHLLPPITRRRSRRDLDSPPPIPPRLEPALPCSAPVDRNISGLYDPALDPSPIGIEERGIAQPVRIARIVPRQESGTQESRGVTRTEDAAGTGTEVTILNGYKTPILGGTNHENDADNESCIDVFVQGFFKNIEHATLLPSGVLRRVLQHGPTPVSMKTAAFPEGSAVSEARTASLGLTVFLAYTRIYLNNSNAQHTQASNLAAGVDTGRDALVLDPSPGVELERTSEKVTRLIFQGQDSEPGPSRNAFRVQFEPGPLGLELEENPSQQGIVQVRRVLQAGQAEQDGRLCAGFLIVAVGDCGVRTFANDADRIDIAGLKACAPDTRAIAKTRPAMVHSLAEFEEAVLSRKPDRLFVIWALDRTAPEAIAALGIPKPTGGHKLFNGSWSSQSLHTGNTKTDSRESTSPSGMKAQGVNEQYMTTAYDVRPGGVSPSTRKRVVGDRTGATALEAPGWESAWAYNDDYRSKNTVPGDKPWGAHFYCSPADRDSLRATRSEADLSSREGSPLDAVHRALSASGARYPPHRTRRIQNRQSCETSEAESRIGKWAFETGGGMFDENDQGLAARRQPPRGDHDASSPEDAEDEQQLLPLGLQASAADKFEVYIWFCNNHESAMMQVR